MVCPLELPPLRGRKGDIMKLFQHFWMQRGETRPLEPAVIRALELHEWPGNVRELENMVERVSVCTEGPVIRLSDLPPHVRQTAALHGNDVTTPALTLVPPPPPSPNLPISVMVPPASAPAPINLNGLGMPHGFEPMPSQGPELQRPVPTPDSLLVEAGTPKFPIDLPNLLRTLEDMYIAAALNQAGGNRKAAADMLGLQRTTLVEKLRRKQRDTQAA
jgi:sigma-54 specific flagellar transcriptional regulator A